MLLTTWLDCGKRVIRKISNAGSRASYGPYHGLELPNYGINGVTRPQWVNHICWGFGVFSIIPILYFWPLLTLTFVTHCYGGLRKKLTIHPPQLPTLSVKTTQPEVSLETNRRAVIYLAEWGHGQWEKTLHLPHQGFSQLEKMLHK